jgi:hypothetical protein
LKRALALLLFTGCGPQLAPETLVTGLRVLAITAEPPEIAPGGSTALSILEMDPSRPGGATTVLWVGCDPDPFDLGRGACNDTSALLMPTSFSMFPPGVKILGFGTKASYSTDAALFSPLMADDPIRQNGTVGQVLAVVIGEMIDPTSTDEQLRALFQRIETQEVKTVMALTRVTVSEKTTRNQNPHLDGLSIDGVALPGGATVQVEAGQAVKLHVQGGDAETYTLIYPDGPMSFTETLVGAWYSSGGRFDQARFDLGTDVVFTAPGSADLPEDPVPDKRTGTMWLVLRDERGGEAFTNIPFFVCDDTLPAPSVTSVDSPMAAGDPVTLSGTSLSSILDVIAGGQALPRGGFNGSVFRADAPDLPSGTYPVSVRTKGCKTVDTGLTLTLP